MRTLLSFLLMLCVGCQDYTMNGVEKRQPQMLVHPQEIDFGRLDAGTEAGHETFVIVNTGGRRSYRIRSRLSFWEYSV